MHLCWASHYHLCARVRQGAGLGLLVGHSGGGEVQLVIAWEAEGHGHGHSWVGLWLSFDPSSEHVIGVVWEGAELPAFPV